MRKKRYNLKLEMFTSQENRKWEKIGSCADYLTGGSFGMRANHLVDILCEFLGGNAQVWGGVNP